MGFYISGHCLSVVKFPCLSDGVSVLQSMSLTMMPICSFYFVVPYGLERVHLTGISFVYCSVGIQDDDDAQLLQQALAMSMHEGASGAAAVVDAAMAEAAADDQDLALALQMSVQDTQGSI
ncbi:26S proteasome non-ATPase regulatory subunit 4 [Hordeum vulgare]|nr:26S proteasome non-ATPase regulatory subunit 4 [Hordeum vulgare]